MQERVRLKRACLARAEIMWSKNPMPVEMSSLPSPSSSSSTCMQHSQCQERHKQAQHKQTGKQNRWNSPPHTHAHQKKRKEGKASFKNQPRCLFPLSHEKQRQPSVPPAFGAPFWLPAQPCSSSLLLLLCCCAQGNVLHITFPFRNADKRWGGGSDVMRI